MNIKNVFDLIGGIVIGGAIGFLAGSRYNQHKREIEAKNNLERAFELYKKTHDEYDRDKMLTELYNGTYYNEEAHKKTQELNARKEELLKAEEIKQENGYSAEEEPEDENEMTTEEYLADHENPSEGDTDGDENPIPKTIDAEAYIHYIDVDDFESETEYDREEITYYEEDEVFCDEDDKRIEDPDQYFGMNAAYEFGRNPVNPDDVIFVRNNWFEKVYQITRIHNSYGRIVLGIEEQYPIN